MIRPLRGLHGLCVFAVCGVVTAGAVQPPAPRKGGNPEAARIKNPVSATAESIAAGKRSYTRLCSKCHGPAGAGDGTGATGPVAPPDMTDDKWDYGGTDGEIFAVIHDGIPGSPDMEAYSSRMSDVEIWNVVNFLRSLTPR